MLIPQAAEGSTPGALGPEYPPPSPATAALGESIAAITMITAELQHLHHILRAYLASPPAPPDDTVPDPYHTMLGELIPHILALTMCLRTPALQPHINEWARRWKGRYVDPRSMLLVLSATVAADESLRQPMGPWHARALMGYVEAMGQWVEHGGRVPPAPAPTAR